jgi:hypothetical protein
VKKGIWLDGRFLFANFRDSRIFAKYPWLDGRFSYRQFSGFPNFCEVSLGDPEAKNLAL